MARPKPIRLPEPIKLASKPVTKLLTRLHLRSPR
jgi:hypothetical protein